VRCAAGIFPEQSFKSKLGKYWMGSIYLDWVELMFNTWNDPPSDKDPRCLHSKELRSPADRSQSEPSESPSHEERPGFTFGGSASRRTNEKPVTWVKQRAPTGGGPPVGMNRGRGIRWSSHTKPPDEGAELTSVPPHERTQFGPGRCDEASLKPANFSSY